MSYDGIRPLIAVAFNNQNEVAGPSVPYAGTEDIFSQALAAARAMLLEPEREAVRVEVRYFDWERRTFSDDDKPLAVITWDDVANV